MNSEIRSSNVFRPMAHVAWLVIVTALSTWCAHAQDSVCARVKIEILQELTLERQAFEARMTINNGLAGIALDTITVDIHFADRNGNPVRATTSPNDTLAKFFWRLQTGSTIPTSIAGGTSNRIIWLIVPAPGAALHHRQCPGAGALPKQDADSADRTQGTGIGRGACAVEATGQHVRHGGRRDLSGVEGRLVPHRRRGTRRRRYGDNYIDNI
jgi:hypothetical protein